MQAFRQRIVRIGLVATLFVALQSGCATYVAVKIPGPVADESISLGAERSTVEVALRATPTNSYPDENGTTVLYKYKDGPHQASKGRVVLYIAGDVFTLFLSELLFWPIEAYASSQTDRIATAHFDAANRLTKFTVARAGGEPLISLTSESPADVAAPPPAAASEPIPPRNDSGGESRLDAAPAPNATQGDAESEDSTDAKTLDGAWSEVEPDSVESD